VPVVADTIPSYEEFERYCLLDNWHENLRTYLKNPSCAGSTPQRAAFTCAVVTRSINRRRIGGMCSTPCCAIDRCMHLRPEREPQLSAR
jgi:hypothetical protein